MSNASMQSSKKLSDKKSTNDPIKLSLSFISVNIVFVYQIKYFAKVSIFTIPQNDFSQI